MPVQVSSDQIRGWLSYGDPLESGVDPRIVAEVQMLGMCDGFVFVIDSRTWRVEAGANHEAFAQLNRDLAAIGKELRTIPVLFQANYRDEADVCSMEWIRSTFHTELCSYAESVAIDGIGVIDSVRTAVRLIVGGSGDFR